MDLAIRAVWDALNSIYKVSFGGGSLSFVAIFVLLHIALAIGTLGLGDQTICDVLRPLTRIFKLGTDSLVDGALEVTVAIPKAVAYYVVLYLRSYMLVLRLLFAAWISVIPALLSPLVLFVGLGFFYGFNTKAEDHPAVFQLAILSVYPSWTYWYWRVDGRRIFDNIRRALRCEG